MTHSQPTHRVRDRIVGYLLRPRIANALALLILLLSSTQLGLHLWPASALIYGLRIDYLSPTLYFLDVLILLYLFLSRPIPRPAYRLLHTIFPLLLVNLLFSLNPLATLSWSLRFLLYLTFILVLPSRLLRPASWILPLAIFFQVVLAGTQVVLGKAVQGPLYYLGERALNVGSPNVAKGEWFGEIVLRAYSTFSHPNVLAGWLVVGCLIMLYLSRHRLITFLTVILTVIGVLLAQSRSAALTLFIFVIPFSFIKSLRARLFYFAVLLIPIFSLFFTNHLSLTDLSVTERFNLQGVSLKIISHYPLFGTGANASISPYPTLVPSLRLLQPDHNSFTLFLSWFGLVGVLAIIASLRPILPTTYHILPTILPLLPLLLLDHYLLTSPQGLFILLLYLRVSGSLTNRQTDSPTR